MSASGDPVVIVVGGGGAMGRYAVRNIARLGSAGQLLVADIDVERVRRLCDEVGPPTAPIELDATDVDGLRDAFERCDIVCNTMGPFSIFGGPILRAALESGCHYLDIDDDWQSTLEAFEMNDLAVEQGRTAIIGIGSSPGMSNLLAVRAAKALDEVDELYTGWSLRHAVAEVEDDYPASGSAAAVEHWLLQCSGTIRIWDDGALTDARPVEPTTLDFPTFGPVRVYSMGHPEPLTLPRTVPCVKRAMNLQTGPGWIFDHLRAVAAEYDTGDVSLEEGAHKLENPPRPAQRGPRDDLPFVWALAHGRRNGENRAVMVYPTGAPQGRMGGNTGVPLAIALDFLVRGRIEQQGVHAPEAVIDENDFFHAYAQLVEPARQRAEDVLAERHEPRA